MHAKLYTAHLEPERLEACVSALFDMHHLRDTRLIFPFLWQGLWRRILSLLVILYHIDLLHGRVASSLDCGVEAFAGAGGRCTSDTRTLGFEDLPKVGWIAHQLHGAIGFTWDYGLHLLTKKILLNKSLNGNSILHSKKIIN